MAGLQPLADKFFILVGILMTTSVCGFSLGIFFASLFESLPVALAVTPLILLPLMLFSGLFVNQGSIPVYFDWIKYLSPMKYGFEALFKNEFTGLVLKDSENGGDKNGEIFIAKYGLKDDKLEIATCAGILCAMVVFLMVNAYFSLSRIVAKQSKSVTIKKGKVAPNDVGVRVSQA